MVSALRAGRQAAIERVSRPRRAHLLGVTAVTGAIALLYSVYSLAMYYRFKTSAYDLTIFDQAVRSYAHFHLGISPLKGVHNGFGPDFSVLGDHFSPIIAVLAPLYWIHNSPSTLLVAQAFLFAAAIPSLWLFTRRALGGGRKGAIAAYLVVIAYGISWPIATAAAFDFHEAAFAPVLTAIAMERFQAGRLRSALIALAALLLVKEDMGLFVAGIGVWLALTSRRGPIRRQWLVGIVLVVVGVAWTAFATYVLIPAFGGSGDYYWAYSGLGKNVPQVVIHIIEHPRSSFLTLFRPHGKVVALEYLFGAFCFLPLLSPIVIIALPLIFERFLNDKFPNWWAIQFQYNSYLVVALICAAVDGAARLDRWLSRAWAFGAARLGGGEPAQTAAAAQATDEDDSDLDVVLREEPPAASRRRDPWLAGKVAVLAAAAMAAIAVYLVPNFPNSPLDQALHKKFYVRTPAQAAAAAADAVVPSGVSVQATQFLAPQLAMRDYVLLWDGLGVHGDGNHPPLLPQYVVASVRQTQFTFHNVGDQIFSVHQYEKEGYTVIFSSHGYLVLRRPAKYDGRPAVPATKTTPASPPTASGQLARLGAESAR